MGEFDGKVLESVTFEEAIALAQSLLDQMEAGKLSEEEIKTAIVSLVKSKDSARGFLGTYLRDDRPLADNPSVSFVLALQSSPEIVGEFLVKSIAMSAAMAITHRRNNNEEMAQGSDRVRRRIANLIQKLQLDLIANKLRQMCESAATGEGNYQAFLQHWGYDTEQRQVIQKVLSQSIAEAQT